MPCLHFELVLLTSFCVFAFSYGQPGGYDEEFDPPLDGSDYQCLICRAGLRDAMQTKCGHRFCRGCISRLVREVDPRCPVDHQPLSDEEDHLRDCKRVEINCPQECGRQVIKKNLQQHIVEDCPNRVVSCEHCGEELVQNGLETHHPICAKYPQSCESCGKENITRDKIDEHLEKECPNTEIKCPFHIVGCTYEGLRANVNKHIIEKLTGHLTDMSEKIAALYTSRGTEPQTQQTAPRRIRGDLGVRPQDQAARKVYLSELLTQTHNHQGEIDELRRRVNNFDNNVHHLERQLEEIRMRPERPIQELTMRHIFCEGKLMDLEGRVCNGFYIWRIENYRQCRQNAINGVNTQLFSPNIYTSRYGYRLCMRINLNGVGSGVGKHVALCVHMMQGDYDAILEWPFTGRIALSILDQSDASEFRHHISETFVARPNLLSFQRPTAPRNYKGYGYVEFAPIEQIREGQYVKNNTMLVRIQICH